MPKFREKTPVIIVDINIWDPAKGLPQVAIETTSEGKLVGKVQQIGRETLTLQPGDALIAYPPAQPGLPPTYVSLPAADVTATYEPYSELEAEGSVSLPALGSGTAEPVVIPDSEEPT